MDLNLSELERRARANPGDSDLASQLDRALLRAGREEQVQERYRSKFRCPLRFEDLPIVADPAKRACARCVRMVSFVSTVEGLAERIARGECVALGEDAMGEASLQLALSPWVHSAEEASRPCLQVTGLRYVDLDSFAVSPAAVEWLPADVAYTYQVVPLTLEADPARLEIACAAPSNAASVIDDLELMLDVEVRLALADPEAVSRALERLYPDLPDEEVIVRGFFRGG